MSKFTHARVWKKVLRVNGKIAWRCSHLHRSAGAARACGRRVLIATFGKPWTLGPERV